jgi:nucleotide-binding universal stress UspA family protein
MPREVALMSRQQEESSGRRIIVGVDGSPSSKAALVWALRQAELTGASVEAVIAWHLPVGVGGTFAPLGILDGPDFGDIAVKSLTEAISQTVDPTSAVKISSTVTEGDATQVLLDAARGAELLVVGSRGHGGFAGALLGSVSQHCAHHAPCPLVIVRERRTRETSN